MRYETWWAVHLYTYLALALAFSHQIHTGASFVGHPFNRAVWTGLWIATAGTVLVYRVLAPAWRTLLHDLRVVSVTSIAPGVVTVVCRGRFLNRLGVAGGQFFLWRILTRGQWWQAHPYSVSALPDPPYMRFTVKVKGDHGAMLSRLAPGTRLAIEGPYGAFTADQRRTDRVLLVGAGIGVTPLRSLLEDLPRHVDVTMIVRATTPEEVLFADELRELLARRRGRLIELTGPRRRWPLRAETLRDQVPDVTRRDVYVCGPTGFTASLLEAARGLGLPEERIHHETFAF
jgi:ferredoxin-NADP reductase